MPTTYAIPNGATEFAATTYSGTSATNNLSNGANNPTGVTFQPDFVWIKNRSSTNSHQLTDSVRGVNLALASDLTIAEYAGNINAFNTNGFQVTGASNAVNASGQTYIGWQWKAGGAAVSNTDGSITSQVSANTTAGFSVVTYTGTGSAATVGHGLGVAPSFIIIKNRTDASNWAIYHASVGNTTALLFDTSTGSTLAAYWNNTSPTSSVYTVGTANITNGSSKSMVAYCWAAVAGYSAFGSYTGNGSADGPFVYLGFRPRFVMIKCSSTGGAGYYWTITDTSRNTSNLSNLTLNPDTSNAEDNSYGMDILSNGFKIRNTYGTFNGNGATYIYACFAENPFKYSNAR